MSRQGNRSVRRAFTLIELLLVMVILAILAAIVVPKFTARSEQAKISAAKTTIANLDTSLDAFEVDMGRYPNANEGLAVLLNAPSDAGTNWHGPYVKKDVGNDPWGHPYIYRYPGQYNKSSYDLLSMGPDGKEGGGDDIDNWSSK
jgi:general secretion pathway protein G